MLRRLSCLLLMMAFGHSVQAATPAQLERSYSTWTVILQSYVDQQGRTDFHGLAKNSESLQQLVAFVSEVSPESHAELFPSQEHVLAYHINAYNILAMYGVIDSGIPKNFGNFFKRARFFKFRSVVVGGDKTSLYDYENKVIRPLGEPRAHFALNCMVKDCPRLPREAFVAERLEQQLDKAATEFFEKDKHIRIQHDEKTVYLSAILDFYTEDFVTSGKPRDLSSYVNLYLSEPLPKDFKIKFIRYDWTINQQP